MFISRSRSQADRQRGYALMVLMIALTVLLIALGVAIPEVAHNLKRYREEEMIHRGAQYARAVRRYYKKFGSYPATLDQLVETNHIRFLRQKYKDPITGKDFKLLHFGDSQLQGLQSSTTMPGAMPAGQQPGQQSAGNNLITGAATQAAGASSQGSLFSDSSTSNPQANQANGQALAASAGASQNGPATQSGQPPNGQSSPATDSSGNGPQPQPLSASASSSGSPTMGGGAIVGVTSTSAADSVRVFNKKRHYNEWAFIYDPTTDRGALIRGPYNGPPAWQQGNVAGAQPAGQLGNSLQNSGASSGSQSPFSTPQNSMSPQNGMSGPGQGSTQPGSETGNR
jgi:type II secretory pathway pseudopilin PulG